MAGLVVLGFEITEVRHGFTSLIFLTISLNDAGREAGMPDRIVIKGGFMHYSRRYFFGYSMEAQSYRDVWPDLGLNVPRTYFVDIDSASQQSIIIMENLNARGVTFTSVYQPLNYQQMRRRVEAIAEIHAKSWDKPESAAGRTLVRRACQRHPAATAQHGSIGPDQVRQAARPGRGL